MTSVKTEDQAEAPPPRRIGHISIRAIIPNMITLLALCAGLTAIRMTFESRFDVAVYAILAAAVLDGLDGRVARYLNSTSKFGAELDSLSDFVSFGVAPAILMYGWILNEVRSVGWVVALVFAIAGGLRLARFNAAIDEVKPSWQSNFFTGVPAPAGAMLVLLPIYISRGGFTIPGAAAPIVLGYVLLIAFLMVSRIPTFSGKKLGAIRRDLVFPLFVGLVIGVGLLLSYPFQVLAAVSIAYLAAIPLGWRSWNKLARQHGAAEQEIGFAAVIEGEDAAEDDEDEGGGDLAERPVLPGDDPDRPQS
jgi:CDP-diacylglycerol---serine O-phosphatidyltransferase